MIVDSDEKLAAAQWAKTHSATQCTQCGAVLPKDSVGIKDRDGQIYVLCNDQCLSEWDNRQGHEPMLDAPNLCFGTDGGDRWLYWLSKR